MSTWKPSPSELPPPFPMQPSEERTPDIVSIPTNVYAMIRLPVSVDTLGMLRALDEIPKRMGLVGYMRQQGQWLVYEARAKGGKS